MGGKNDRQPEAVVNALTNCLQLDWGGIKENQ
jgi:hypothetical protein